MHEKDSYWLPFAAVVERLKTIYSQTSKPLTDDTIEVSRFCRYLESILRHGQKGES